MEFRPHIVIIAIVLGGLFSWLRYVSLKREVGRSTAKQMMPFEFVEITVLSMVIGVLFSLTGLAEKIVWLVVAVLMPLWVTIEVIRVITPVATVDKVLLEPDPSFKNARWNTVLFLLIGAYSLVLYFERDQSDPFRLAYSALFIGGAGLNLLERFKPAMLTETGYYSHGKRVRWADIEAYQWLGESNTHDLLVYQRKIRWRLPIKSIRCVSIPAIHQPKVNEFLSRYVTPAPTLSVALD